MQDLAKLILSSIFGFPAEEFSFSKGPGGEPVPLHSHHGRYCAVAWASEGVLTAARIKQIRDQLADKTECLQI